MREFYKHRYGERRPHRGGQAILKFAPSLLVYWAPTDACADAEDKMIERFRKLVGGCPMAIGCARHARSGRHRPSAGAHPQEGRECEQ